MNVPLLDLKRQYARIAHEIEPVITEICASQYFILGPEVEKCEHALAEYCHAAYAIGVSSGTDALLLALMAEGIGPGDEVITSPFTFFATAGCIARTGATPVFADIEPGTFNLDPAAVEAAITPRTRAIMPVHLYGQCVEMDDLMAIAKKHNLVVIEDAAQAIGAEYKGKRAGSIGHYGCFSFFPTKNLGAFGDGGLVTTQTPELAEKLRILRVHGMAPRYYHHCIGGNFRLDALQAAVVRIKLAHLETWTSERQNNARRYEALFADAGLSTSVVTLPTHPGTYCQAAQGKRCRHVFNQYVIRVSQRDELRARLAEQHVGTEVYYPLPLHLQKCFVHMGLSEGAFPESEKAAKECLALPIYPELTESEAMYVVDRIAAFYA